MNVGNTSYHEMLFETKPCASAGSANSAGDSNAMRYEKAAIRRVQLYQFAEDKQSGAVNVLRLNGQKIKKASGGSAEILVGSCTNAR